MRAQPSIPFVVGAGAGSFIGIVLMRRGDPFVMLAMSAIGTLAAVVYAVEQRRVACDCPPAR